MGILDRALKAAAMAKEQIGEVREVHALAQRRPVPAVVPDAQEQAIVARALALGAPEPFALLSLEEASEVAGVPLGGPRVVYGDDTIGVAYAATGPRQRRWSVEAQAFHAVDEDTPYDASAHWHAHVAEHVRDGGRRVDGLGDDAIAREDEVFVLAGPLLLFTTVSLPGDQPATGHAIRAARKVLARLG